MCEKGNSKLILELTSCCPKGKDPKKCTPEQIKECHPEAKDKHPCEDKPEEKPKE